MRIASITIAMMMLACFNANAASKNLPLSFKDCATVTLQAGAVFVDAKDIDWTGDDGNTDVDPNGPKSIYSTEPNSPTVCLPLKKQPIPPLSVKDCAWFSQTRADIIQSGAAAGISEEQFAVVTHNLRYYCPNN